MKLRSLPLLIAPLALMATVPAAAADVAPVGPSSAIPNSLSPALPPLPTAAVSAFMASRRDAPIWYRAGGGPEAAATLATILRRAAVDGLPAGPELAVAIEMAARDAAGGNPAAIANADRLISASWLAYVTALRAPYAGITYSDPRLAPRAVNSAVELYRASVAPSPALYLAQVASVNPIYAPLRDAAWAALQKSGGLDPRVTENLARARALPSTGKYVVVDSAAQRLTMIDNGRIADSMKVIVGTRESQTPMLASTIWYATLNPYWYVPTDLTRKTVATRMLKDAGYLKTKQYEVISDFGLNPTMVPPSSIDWKAVAAGTKTVYLRQLPGKDNSMGQIKFPFPNDTGVYLHDTNLKALFAQNPRTLSNGCVRLEDAQRLARWLFGSMPTTASTAPEQHVRLPAGVPVYLTYLTAQATNGQIAFLNDPYGRDRPAGPKVAER